MADFQFQVGGTYANREGEYRVLSVDRKTGRMEVQFLASGLSRTLDMGIQARIRGNLDLEARLAARPPAPPPGRAARPKLPGREFAGMRPEDFLDTVTGTTWRSRESLGGGLAALLGQHFQLPFQSVAPYRWARVFLTHQPAALSDPEEARKIAKYTVWADTRGLHYGVYVERLDAGYRDWERLAQRLAEDAELRALVSELEAQGLRMHAFRNREGVLEPLLVGGEPWEARLEALDPRHDGVFRDLYLNFSLSVDEAVARGRGLLDDVAEALVKLAPLYRAAAL